LVISLSFVVVIRAKKPWLFKAGDECRSLNSNSKPEALKPLGVTGKLLYK
jgi:hypothetical protein